MSLRELRRSEEQEGLGDVVEVKSCVLHGFFEPQSPFNTELLQGEFLLPEVEEGLKSFGGLELS